MLAVSPGIGTADNRVSVFWTIPDPAIAHIRAAHRAPLDKKTARCDPNQLQKILPPVTEILII
jgi:hypothetical protein